MVICYHASPMSVKSVLREPLLHFLAIGAALFVYFHWSGGGSGPASGRIVLTAGQITQLAAGFAKTWQRQPTDVEIKGLVDDWVREEIAVREAMAMGCRLPHEELDLTEERGEET